VLQELQILEVVEVLLLAVISLLLAAPEL